MFFAYNKNTQPGVTMRMKPGSVPPTGMALYKLLTFSKSSFLIAVACLMGISIIFFPSLL